MKGAKTDGFAKELCVAELERTIQYLRELDGRGLVPESYGELLINTVNGCDILREALS